MQMREGVHARPAHEEQVHELPVLGHEWAVVARGIDGAFERENRLAVLETHARGRGQRPKQTVVAIVAGFYRPPFVSEPEKSAENNRRNGNRAAREPDSFSR